MAIQSAQNNLSNQPAKQVSAASRGKSVGSGAASSVSLFWFAAATLLGAFMVFQVQPIISKCVLPWFGGTPAVWTTCMLFFQLLLFGGYLYAHLLRTYCRPSVQAIIHLSLLSAAVLMLPIEPSDAWKPMGDEAPTVYLLGLLLAHVGLPYFVLSSTGPLIQAWLSYHDNSDRVYRLYALSNAGSLAALLSYPFVVEPFLSVTQQSTAWSLMLCVFLLVQGMVAIKLFRVGDLFRDGDPAEERGDDQPDSIESELPGSEISAKVDWKTRAAWVGLPALASTMLLVVTNHVCQDVAVVPFLWVLPLSLYLASFIVCFDSPQWYRPKLIALVTGLSILGIESKSWLSGHWQLASVVLSFMTFLFGVCLMCHGEVARMKPRARLLTQYYALMSAGGAIGGLLVAVVCPLVFNSYLELPISMVIVQGLVFVLFVATKGWKTSKYDWNRAYKLRYFAGMLVLFPMIGMMRGSDDQVLASERNFFGTLRVLQDHRGSHLVHGSTIHGMQRSGENSGDPTTYYSRDSGVGRAMTELQSSNNSLRIGVVGLGCGVLATYGRPNDEFDLVEINPAVIEIAKKHFTFIAECPSQLNFHLGDGRLVLDRMSGRKFDLLVLDAFSSDAIPAHLLTYEAIESYQERLADDGVLAIHVSNTHLDLEPLVHRICDAALLQSKTVKTTGVPANCTSSAIWVLATRDGNPVWHSELLANAISLSPKQIQSAPFWTDQNHNLLSVLRSW